MGNYETIASELKDIGRMVDGIITQRDKALRQRDALLAAAKQAVKYLQHVSPGDPAFAGCNAVVSLLATAIADCERND